jgi:hypothetical protein
MEYKIFLDDERHPQDKDYVVCRSTDEALNCIKKNGMPYHFSFDHDLGGDDTVMVFLKKLYNYWDEKTEIPSYYVHSANPIGKNNIISFMESWKKAYQNG